MHLYSHIMLIITEYWQGLQLAKPMKVSYTLHFFASHFSPNFEIIEHYRSKNMNFSEFLAEICKILCYQDEQLALKYI